MRVFSKNGKINFVDDNNVFVGFDIGQSCCETARWLIANVLMKELSEGTAVYSEEITDEELETVNKTLDGFQFDADFFEDLVDTCPKWKEEVDEGGAVAFRLTRKFAVKSRFKVALGHEAASVGSEEKFLHLYNCHNGYYGHGFSMGIRSLYDEGMCKMKHEGTL